MPILTRSELQSYVTDRAKTETARLRKAASRQSAISTVFLSHSHRDADLVAAASNLIASHGVSVYVDWLDPEMPEITSPVTAVRLQEKIDQNRRFVMLATDRSISSRWVPWELGYANGVKEDRAIAILPVVERIGQRPTEYLGIYHRIELGTSGRAFVYKPGSTEPLTTLEAWLR